MTDLQLSLMAAGGVFIVGVFSYNKWQEHKAKKSVERAFSSDHDDVLMRAGEAPQVRQEPSFSSDEAAAPARGPAHAPSAAPEHAAGQHAAGAAGAGADAATATPAAAAPGHASPEADKATSLVDPLIDCLLPLALEGAARGEKILPALQTLRMVGNKPVHYIGLAVSGEWEPIVHGGVYTKLQGGVQLASRSTALNELEYSELVTRLRAMADEIGAEPEIPDMIEVMAEARNLHRFVAGHDAQLGVNLASNGAPWSIVTLLGALEKQGFDLRPDGRYVMPDGEGGHLFTLSTNVTLAEETTARLTLLLDVPCVAPARDGFGAMVACAKSLVGRLDATIVDDYNQPLSDAALAEIAGQVQDFYTEMNDADIPAGSTRALRLFS
ncbi:cell division protein ZipA C-terminal FtsZ-binding domain-containing protein [Rugamonas sp. DEMB1]|uniref:cell division protein ZipA C-terminal FtsZ-binding domain-containing protein n=1 Tax=Rugamonas sp. DEMB1 TaxID=3039386 RepID=UPI00244A8EFD|nr:cell division protein ZipA C-terminal FtsZ-binding domain-containing protein [Rugamonas sp. DEMB1]WGG48306.1 cell division protein ZipA C-terminal FtsZ-binding domain-containing protein [Rugamonas sp. DEMB1]